MDFDAVFLKDSVIQKEGLYVYNTLNIVGKHYHISIATVRSRVESLVINKYE
jgi:hypothetical protein